jgi:hypothetical protein
MTGASKSLERIHFSPVDVLSQFKRLRSRTAGTSMLPSLRPGDILQIEACAAADAEVGNIVLFRSAGWLVVHRVNKCTAAGLVTQGDGLARPDAPVAASDVLGRVIGVERHGRTVSHRPSRTLPLTRWLFGRSTLAARLFLRWHSATVRASA